MGIVWVKGSHYSGCVEIPLNFWGIPSYKVYIICDVNNLGEYLKEEIVFSVEYGFNPIWKIWVKIGWFPQSFVWKIAIWNHQVVKLRSSNWQFCWALCFGIGLFSDSFITIGDNKVTVNLKFTLNHVVHISCWFIFLSSCSMSHQNDASRLNCNISTLRT